MGSEEEQLLAQGAVLAANARESSPCTQSGSRTAQV